MELNFSSTVGALSVSLPGTKSSTKAVRFGAYKSFSVKICHANGAGFNGNGCVSNAFSPINLELG